MMKLLRTTFVALMGAALLSMAGAANAQPAWPTKPVKLIVPFAPGAGADIGARLAADVLSRKWGQPVIVENRPGGDSLIAIRAVINDNDDHQFLFTPTGNFTPHPFRHEKLGYVRERDLLPVARFSNTILSVSVSETLGIKTLGEFVELAKKKPNEMNVMVVPGITELVWDGFTTTLGLKITKVPFTNLTQGASEMTTGRIQAVMTALAIQQPVLQSGGARLVAVTSRNRIDILKDVPTAIEAGVPSLELEGLVGMFGPKSLSPELRKRIGEEVAAVARLPEVAEKLVTSGQVPNPGGADEFSADIVKQENQVAAIAKLIGLKRMDP
jgi:tripartite-type tricarboxylate transporter receptor subunit TctC